MKKVLFTVLSIIIVLIGVIVFIGYREIQYDKRASAVVTQIISKEADLQKIDYNSLGKYGEFIKTFGEAFYKSDKDLENIELELKKYENINLFDEKIIKDPIEGKKASKELVNILPKFEATMQSDIELLKGSFEKIKLNAKEKEIVNKEINDLNDKLIKEIRPAEESLKTLTSKLDEYYDFLISKKGKYVVKDNTISFNSAKDVDKYNELIKAIEDAAQNIK